MAVFASKREHFQCIPGEKGAFRGCRCAPQRFWKDGDYKRVATALWAVPPWGILLQRPAYVSDAPAEKKATLRAKRNRPAPPSLPM
jgi:hypothetical protein